MTTRLNPAGPKLVMDDEETTGVLSDSEWDGTAEDEAQEAEQQAQANLGRIARARKANGGNSSEG
jgi:hypothetical protein